MTYLANRPSRRNPILSLTPFIQTLVRHPWVRASAVIGRGPPPRPGGGIQPGPVLAQFAGSGRASASMVSPDCGQIAAQFTPSWPGSSRPSTSSLAAADQVVDARDKPGHDELRKSAVEQLPQNLVHRLAVLLRRRIVLRRRRLRRGLIGRALRPRRDAAALARLRAGRARSGRSTRRRAQAAEPLLQQVADRLAEIAAA